MAAKEEIDMLEALILDCRPRAFFQKLDEADNGAGAVLRILHQLEGPVTSGMITRRMGVSSARVAALLKRLENRGLVSRVQGTEDARQTIVGLTEAGAATVEHMYADYCEDLARLIDSIGLDRLREFMLTAKEINSVMKGPPDILEIIDNSGSR